MIILKRVFGLHQSYTKNKTAMEKSMSRLATGDRLIQPGHGMGGDLSLSEKYRYRIKTAEAATNSLQHGMTYINQADYDSSVVIDLVQRMSELAAFSLNSTLLDADRQPVDVEFQQLKDELAHMTKTNTIFDKQTIGRDAVVTFDTDDNQVRFYQPNGGDPGYIERKFDSAATDSLQQFIGFSQDRDFSMSRDGRSLMFIGTDTTGANFSLKSYDINGDLVRSGTDAFAATDKLVVDEEGDGYVNGSGTLYTVDPTSLKRTATAIADMTVGSQFSVYKDEVTYFNNANQVVKYNLNSATTTTLIADTTTVITPPPAYAANVFAAGGVDHAFSASGRYIADEVDPGTIRVFDTSTGTGTFLNIGAANTVNDIQFNEDGDRVYFVDAAQNAIRYLDVSTDSSNAVNLTAGQVVIEGKNDVRLDGLDLGGSNFNSIVPFVLQQDSSNLLEYEAADMRLYGLGLLEASVDTYANASTALDAMDLAMNKATAERTKLGAIGRRFGYAMDTHRQYIADSKDIESQIRNVDLAEESSFLASSQMKYNAAISMVTQHNEALQSLLMLLQ